MRSKVIQRALTVGAALLASGAIMVGGASSALAVANPTHSIQNSVPTLTRGSTTGTVTFTPTPTGSVNGITFNAPAGVMITAGCPGASAATPVSSCTITGPISYLNPITLTLSISATAAAGTLTGTAVVKQSDDTTVSDPFRVTVADTHSIQGSVPVTAPGATGTTTFTPTPTGSVNAITFNAPAGVQITSGCPGASAATPVSSCTITGPISYINPITLGYTVPAGAASDATLTGTATVTQRDGTVVSDPFLVRTPPVSGAPIVSRAGLGLASGLALLGGLVVLRKRRSQIS